MHQESRSLPASAGFLWFKSAVSATLNQPVLLMGAVLFYMISMSFLSVLPWVGPVLAAVFMPFGTVFFAHATRDALNGNRPNFAHFMDIVRDADHRTAMIRVGLVFGLILVVVNALYGYLSADEIARWVTTEDNRLNWDSVRANIPWDAALVLLVVYIPGLTAVWFAPLLVSEKNMACGKAIFYSFFGCLRNILPVLVLGIALITLSIIVMTSLTYLVMALGLEDMALFIVTPFVFILSTIIYASYWPMYESLFEDVR